MHFVFRLIGTYLLALAVGLISAWYMIVLGTPLTTRHIGPWTVWHAAGAPTADPYTRAHHARAGALPITSESALYYTAFRDDDGRRLVSSCEYLIVGQPMSAAWWSIALYDADGRLIPNKADRHSFSNREVVRRVDGSFRITLSGHARPGNWLPSGEDHKLQIVLRLFAPRGTAGSIDSAKIERQLPQIVKRECA